MNEQQVYLAGEMFNFKHLLGNAVLGEAISKASNGRFTCQLPQDIESREVRPADIRIMDIKALRQSDVGIFHFDGAELDSGTVAEYMIAKFIDLPTVIVRTDFRKAGDQHGKYAEPWSLMVSGYPRTKVLVVDALQAYQQVRSKGQLASDAVLSALQEFAERVVDALDEVIARPRVLKDSLQKPVNDWLDILIEGEHAVY